jgi:hypothetical protein
MYAYVVVAAIAAVGAWQVQNWRYDAMEKDRAQQEAKEQIRKAERVDQAAAAHEKDKVRIETKYRTVTKEIVREVEKPVYRNVCISPDGVRNINDLIEHDAASESPRAVPEAAATPNRDR